MERSANLLAATVAAVVPSGILAGALSYGRVNVVPTFEAVPLDVHLTFRVALFGANGLVMPVLMGIGFVGAVWLALAARGRLRVAAAGAAVLTAVTAAVTRFGNVPANDEVRAWLATGPAPDYVERLRYWGVLNDLRLTTAVAAFVVLVVALASAAVRAPRPVEMAR
ncbi:anthrone oxygenase family protein [Pseudonocardia lacus]|uniref:anthrone oxygenase family protein n=1 Tax=Pseudonocardia lacus TaxID=2835865 RepID=UPI001BDD1E51|nr:anthrone oxygenase family protein [Pseudonocardia lacus]